MILQAGLRFPGRVIQLLEDEGVTALPGVPTVFNVLLSLRGLAEREFPHLRVLTNAGAALPAATVAELRRVFPAARLYSMYGQTECQRVCYLPPSELDARPTSVGIAIPGTRAWVEDPEGGVAAPGVVGELMVVGDHVMQGYWNDPEETAAKIRPGRWPWERVMVTGDLFRTDEDGFLYFVARRDDIIKSGGEKVPPREVEEVLHTADGVREAAVIGIPDKMLGEAVCAHVALDSGHGADAAAIRRHCAEHLEDYMVPRKVVFHEQLPRTDNGKLDRQALSGRPVRRLGRMTVSRPSSKRLSVAMRCRRTHARRLSSSEERGRGSGTPRTRSTWISSRAYPFTTPATAIRGSWPRSRSRPLDSTARPTSSTRSPPCDSRRKSRHPRSVATSFSATQAPRPQSVRSSSPESTLAREASSVPRS